VKSMKRTDGLVSKYINRAQITIIMIIETDKPVSAVTIAIKPVNAIIQRIKPKPRLLLGLAAKLLSQIREFPWYLYLLPQLISRRIFHQFFRNGTFVQAALLSY